MIEVKAGYKQTEVGVIPEDWDVKTLGEIGSFSKGQGVRKDQSQSGELPCIRYGELYTRHSNYIKQYHSFISKEIATTAKKIVVGDILFAGSGETKEEIGKCAALIDSIDAYAGGDIVILSPHSTDSLFLGYLLNSPIAVKQKASKGQGDAVVHITASNLKDVQIPLPKDKSEQTAIATILSDTDALIERLEKLITKKIAIKQGTMQQLLTGKKRLPGFEKKEGYKQTMYGVIPDTWDIDLLGNNIKEMTDFVAAGSFEALRNNVKIYDNPNYAIYVRLYDLRLGLGHTSQKYVDKNSYNFLEKSNLFGDEILMANIGANVGETFLMPKLSMSATIAPNMIVIRSDNNKLEHDYLLYYSQSKFGQDRLFELIAGSGHPKINKTDLKKFSIIIPPLPEQTAIATILSDMDTEIESLEQKRDKYTMLKQGMMQQLLTGRIRIHGTN